MVRSRLLTVVHAFSMGVGLVAGWLPLGVASVVLTGAASVVGLLVVFVLRTSGSQVGYQTGLVGGLLATSWVGLLSLGLVGVLWVLALAATTAPVRALWQRGRRELAPARARRGASSPAPRSVQTPASAVAAMGRAGAGLAQLDLEGLCTVWRRSYFQLLDATSPVCTAAVVGYRQRILDEMGVREPAGLDRWLTSGPRASGNPLPYLRSRTALDEAGGSGPRDERQGPDDDNPA